MAIIAVKNPDLYRAWLAHLRRYQPDSPALRTTAFFASERGDPVPLF